MQLARFSGRKKVIIGILMVWVFCPEAFTQAGAQPSDTSRNSAIKLFMDCQGCDMNYIREEMPYVNYVREVRDAQVYLFIARQNTGSGGQNYTLFYQGQQEMTGMNDTITYSSGPDDTNDVSRAGLTNTIALGLMRYVAKTPVKNTIQIRYMGASVAAPPQVEDKWNNWVFELQTQPRFSVEKSVESYSWNNNIRADRITPEWKIQLSANQSYSKSIYIRERVDEETQQSYTQRTDAIRKSWSFANTTVNSLGDHWSTGFRAGMSSSSYNNMKFKAYFTPGIEYNLFPYYEATRRQLRVFYSLGYVHNSYNDTTIYNKIVENLGQQSLSIALRIQQKWGSANVSVSGSNYLHDFEKNQVQFDGNLRLRIFKGLSLNVDGGVAFIHNQIELVKGDVSNEDLYLQLRQLETGFRYDGSLGITYTFGSMYNNVVNPRF